MSNDKELDGIDIITGKVLASHEGVDIESYYEKASASFNDYVIQELGDSTSQLEVIDTALRVVLAPHLVEIDNLKAKLDAKDKEIERLKKQNKILLNTVKRYAGYSERRINGRPKESWNCQGYNWIVREKKASWIGKKIFGEKDHVEYVHAYMNNVGMVECGGGWEIAEQALRELGNE